MSLPEIEHVVRDAMQTILGQTFAPGEDVRRDSVPSWDSLRHVELIFAIESSLNVQFTADEMGELDSLQKLVNAAEVHLRAA